MPIAMPARAPEAKEALQQACLRGAGHPRAGREDTLVPRA